MQSSPVARQSAVPSSRHFPPWHWPLQHSSGPPQSSPTRRQASATHAPPRQAKEQQSAPLAQAAPAARQRLVHARFVVPVMGSHRPEQHSLRPAHAAAGALHAPAGRQRPASQRPVQHSLPVEQVASRLRHARSATVQVLPPPSGRNEGGRASEAASATSPGAGSVARSTSSRPQARTSPTATTESATSLLIR